MCFSETYGTAHGFTKHADQDTCTTDCDRHDWKGDKKKEKLDHWVEHQIITKAQSEKLLKNKGKNHVVQCIGQNNKLDGVKIYHNSASGWLQNMSPTNKNHLLARWLM